MEKVISVKMVPKSLKGKNRIREAGTDRWEVLKEGTFQGTPALLVQPSGKTNMLRWVLIVGDRDFEVTDHQILPNNKG